MLLNSINLIKISYFYKNYFLILINLPLIILIFCRIIAEINRTPFDLSEGESELISGFNIEYRRGNFTLIFLAEYSKLIFIIILFNLIFLSNNSINFSFYWLIIIIIYFITWIRITLPRIRYDKLIRFCWLYLLPLNLNLFLIYLLFKFYIDLIYLFN